MAKPFFRETRAVQPRIVFGDAPCLKLSMDGYKTQRAIRFIASASSQISETKMVGQSPHYDRFTYRIAGKVYVNRIPAIRFSALRRVRHRIIAKIPASVPARHRHTFGGEGGAVAVVVHAPVRLPAFAPLVADATGSYCGNHCWKERRACATSMV